MHALKEILTHTVMITAFVAVMMVVIEYLNVRTRGVWEVKLQENPSWQYVLAALLGIIPGCLGSFTVVAMYLHGSVTAGAVVAAMIATSGDAAFFLMAEMPKISLLVFVASALIGIISGFILGIDIGRINTNFILLDLEQKIIAEVRKKSIKLSNDISIVDDLYSEIDKILKDADVNWGRILGIGISIPGYVQGPLGTSETYFNFGSKPLNKVLEERFKKPVHIEHDAKAMALGEMWFGMAKNMKNVLCVNIGWLFRLIFPRLRHETRSSL